VGHRRIVESAAVPRADILVPEANSMHRAARYVVSLFLAAAIAAPLSKLTAAAPQNTNVQVRVYDRDHATITTGMTAKTVLIGDF
jgi:hypothetical protein